VAVVPGRFGERYPVPAVEFAYCVSRAIVSTEAGFRVRSRRGWDMTSLVPELNALPVFATLDGELCAFGQDGSPDFPLICEWMLMRRTGIRVTYMVFDLVSVDGQDLTGAPYSERRTQLEALNLNSVHWQTPETFDDGSALSDAVCAHELEGVVAKRKRSRYRPAERGWVKIKNRNYWRYEMERESAISARRVRQFV
jgi:bifunctional non-homologous end joining protein LigD